MATSKSLQKAYEQNLSPLMQKRKEKVFDLLIPIIASKKNLYIDKHAHTKHKLKCGK